ncbi:hypothetical protein KP509_18G069200 [Ceratopteris richardii]|nr:hypothetical protein KP509_18G069200 [Ceratopteris richardii]
MCVHRKAKSFRRVKCMITADVDAATFPSFLPPEVMELRDINARALASRIIRLPVQTKFSEKPIMTSCVKPTIMNNGFSPLLLLHGFDSSCLEWRNAYHKLEEANLESWAFDVLGWGFSNSEDLASFGVEAKREHLYEFWKSYIRRPMVLVGASLGGAVAIDFTLAYPEVVSKLVLINAQCYAEGTGKMATFPKLLAYAGVSILKSVFLRVYANTLVYYKVPWDRIIDQMKIGRLHCFMPGWTSAAVDFMLSGGYNVASCVSEVKKDTLIIWGKEDIILEKDTPQKFMQDLPNAKVAYIDECGHLPHVEKPDNVVALISEFCST